MMNDCPDPKEVSDFHFLQLKTLRIIKDDEPFQPCSINTVATTSKYGLLFIGVGKGFKVIHLEDVLKIDEDKENRSIEEKFPSTFVPCAMPVVLTVNASQTILAVGVTGSVIHFYSLTNFPGPNGVWQPFHSHALSAELKDFVWNPVIENLFALCLSDGSLHVLEMSGTAVKAAAHLPAANSLSVCWSPKGKQLVVGKKDGSFSQYKPNLQLVSTVPPPALEEGPVSVTSICWISNTVFAVVYVANDAPYLFIVNTPKGGPITYTNYNDICLGNCSAPEQKYLMHFEPLWGILVCASFDSIEIVVLGDMPNWVQWDLKEDGKALLPGKDGATNAIGMAVMYSAQRQIVISESESYPPMPVIFFLTNNGLLVSFHMINAKADAPSLVYPPETLELKRQPDVTGLQPVNMTQTISSSPMTQSPQVTPFTAGLPDMKGLTASSVSQQTPPVSKVLPNIASGGIQISSTFSLESAKRDLSGGQSFTSFPSKPEAVPSVDQGKTQIQMNPVIPDVEKRNEVESSTANSYMTAILSEIQNFTKELQELKQLQSSSPAMESEEDMATLKVFAMNMQNFQKDINETMQSISSDIFSLKNVLLESFVMVEEASSRDRRRNDHLYITMLKERALDPITAKRMQKIHQHYQYLNTQLQEVSDRLDQDWINRMAGKRRNNPVISSSEAIYKTIVSNQKTIHNLRQKVNMLIRKVEEKKLQNTIRSESWGRYHKRSTQDDLSKLADEFLQVKIAQKEDRGEQPSVNKKLSQGSQNLLRDFLKQSNVMTVRPTVVYSPAQSRLLSNAITSEDYTSSNQTQDTSPPKQVTPPEKEVPSPVDAAPTKGSAHDVSPARPYAPVCEPITPPNQEASPQLVNKTITNSAFGKEKYSEQDGGGDVSISAMNSAISSGMTQKDSAEKRSSLNVSISVQSIEQAPKISFPTTGLKTVAWGQTSSVTVSSPSSSIMSPKTISFIPPNIPKSSEGSTPLSFSSSNIASPQASSFQFGLQKSVSSPVSTVLTPQTVTPVQSSSVFLNSSSQQQPTVNQSSSSVFPVSATSGFSFLQKTSETSASLTSTAAVQNSENVLSNKNLSHNQASKNTSEFIFQKPFENVGQPVLPTKNTDSTILSTQPSESPSFFQAAGNKTVSDGLKSQMTPEPSSLLSEMPKIAPIKPVASSISTNEVAVTSQTVVSNQSNSKTFPVLTSTESPVPVTEPPLLKPFPVTTSVTVIEAPTSVTSQQTNSTSVATAPSVTSVSDVLSLSALSFSKTTTATPPTSTPQITSSTPTTVFGETISSPPPPPPTSAETKTSDSTVAPSFGMSPTPLFGQAKPETSSFFSGAKTDAPPAFGQTTPVQSSPFGQPAPTTTFAAPGGFFSQTPSFGTPEVAPAAVTSQSDFNNQSSTFSFGKPAFGQTSGSFGLAKSLFGQSTNTFSQSGNAASSFSFSQGGSSGVFGQGSFMSGLGGKPSEENASKNVFGMSSAVKPADNQASNLFKNATGTSGFGVSNTGAFSSGTFSSGGGSVAQSGFGSFQQTPAQQPGGFGGAPAFGSPPGFGAPPAFGSTPSFGSGSPLSSMFGQQQVASNFSNFANASTPTFGALASQTASPGFGSPPGGFGSPPAFGSSFGGQSPSFGSPGSPPSSSSAFTQWRN